MPEPLLKKLAGCCRQAPFGSTRPAILTTLGPVITKPSCRSSSPGQPASPTSIQQTTPESRSDIHTLAFARVEAPQAVNVDWDVRSTLSHWTRVTTSHGFQASHLRRKRGVADKYQVSALGRK